MKYLIGYDISDEKRLQKIYKRMTEFATPIQYSIFLFEGNLEYLQKSLDDILNL